MARQVYLDDYALKSIIRESVREQLNEFNFGDVKRGAKNLYNKARNGYQNWRNKRQTGTSNGYTQGNSGDYQGDLTEPMNGASNAGGTEKYHTIYDDNGNMIASLYGTDEQAREQQSKYPGGQEYLERDIEYSNWGDGTDTESSEPENNYGSVAGGPVFDENGEPVHDNTQGSGDWTDSSADYTGAYMQQPEGSPVQPQYSEQNDSTIGDGQVYNDLIGSGRGTSRSNATQSNDAGQVSTLGGGETTPEGSSSETTAQGTTPEGSSDGTENTTGNGSESPQQQQAQSAYQRSGDPNKTYSEENEDVIKNSISPAYNSLTQSIKYLNRLTWLGADKYNHVALLQGKDPQYRLMMNDIKQAIPSLMSAKSHMKSILYANGIQNTKDFEHYGMEEQRLRRIISNSITKVINESRKRRRRI